MTTFAPAPPRFTNVAGVLDQRPDVQPVPRIPEYGAPVDDPSALQEVTFFPAQPAEIVPPVAAVRNRTGERAARIAHRLPGIRWLHKYAQGLDGVDVPHDPDAEHDAIRAYLDHGRQTAREMWEHPVALLGGLPGVILRAQFGQEKKRWRQWRSDNPEQVQAFNTAVARRAGQMALRADGAVTHGAQWVGDALDDVPWWDIAERAVNSGEVATAVGALSLEPPYGPIVKASYVALQVAVKAHQAQVDGQHKRLPATFGQAVAYGLRQQGLTKEKYTRGLAVIEQILSRAAHERRTVDSTSSQR